RTRTGPARRGAVSSRLYVSQSGFLFSFSRWALPLDNCRAGVTDKSALSECPSIPRRNNTVCSQPKSFAASDCYLMTRACCVQGLKALWSHKSAPGRMTLIALFSLAILARPPSLLSSASELRYLSSHAPETTLEAV